MSKENGRMVKPIAFDKNQVEELLNIKEELGYGTLTMIVRDAVDYYIQNQAYQGRLDIYKDIEE